MTPTAVRALKEVDAAKNEMKDNWYPAYWSVWVTFGKAAGEKASKVFAGEITNGPQNKRKRDEPTNSPSSSLLEKVKILSPSSAAAGGVLPVENTQGNMSRAQVSLQ
jgi:hypothetical protein